MNTRTLSDDLRASAARSADRTAVVYGDRRLTYAELDRAVDGFAAGLRQLGVRRGDRVAVVLANGVETAIAIYGALRAGAAFTPLNATAKEEKLAYLLEHSGSKVAVCDARNAHLVENAAIRAPELLHIVGVGGRIGDTPSLEELVEYEPDAPDAYPETYGRRPGVDHLHVGLDRGAEGRRRSCTATWASSRTRSSSTWACAARTASCASCRSRTRTGCTT